MLVSSLPTTNPAPGTQIRVEHGRAAFRPDQPSQAPETESEQVRVETALLRKLSTRDREVRSHEAAHSNVGGAYAAAPRFSYQIGPNGRSYAVGGEVSISTSPVHGDPAQTLRKASIVRQAALAPAQPSPQDVAIAAKAAQMAIMAQAQIALTEGQEASSVRAEQSEGMTASNQKAVEIYQQVQDGQ